MSLVRREQETVDTNRIGTRKAYAPRAQPVFDTERSHSGEPMPAQVSPAAVSTVRIRSVAFFAPSFFMMLAR